MGFIDNLNWRYATKKFNGKKLPKEVLEKIILAIRLAPSSFGLQPYHISIIEGDILKQAAGLHPWNQDQLATCSHLFILSADSDIDSKIKTYLKLATEAKLIEIIEDAEFDYGKEAKKFIKKMGPEWAAKQVYIALGFAMAACAELNIDSCPMEAFDLKLLKKILNLPKNLEPKVLLAVGYRSRDDVHAKSPKIRFAENDLFDYNK